MDSRATEIIKRGDRLYSKRQTLMSLWQEIAEQFYPERADFTVTRNLGQDFASHLTTSYPLLARRELGNNFSTMLRPLGTEWMTIGVAREDKLDHEGRLWLDEMTRRQFRAMSDRKSLFDRATSEADQDYATFGQAVISVEMNSSLDRLLYRCHHLRDVAWSEGHEGSIDEVHVKWHADAQQVVDKFPKTASQKLKNAAKKDPCFKVECRRVVMKAERYSDKKWKTPFVSVYIDVTHQEVLEESGSWDLIYAIPRWQTVSGSQYAYSPATVAALPDARLIQAISLVLLEAGEKNIDPPLLAVEEALRSDVNLIAGGITFIDADYDERLGEVLRPLTRDKSGMPLGLEMQQDIREMISQAFFLNKLNLPPAGDGTMTAYEVGQRIQEYIRAAAPLFGPTLTEYNGQICDLTFERLRRNGLFGSDAEIPQSLLGQDIEFKFESPLHDAMERAKSQKFMEVKGLLREAADLDPGVVANVNINAAFRDAALGLGSPASWLVSEEEVAETQQALKDRQEGEEVAQGMMQAGQVVQQAGNAGQALNAAMAG